MDDIFLTRVTVRTEHMAHVTVLGTVAECSEGSGEAGAYYCQTQCMSPFWPDIKLYGLTGISPAPQDFNACVFFQYYRVYEMLSC